MSCDSTALSDRYVVCRLAFTQLEDKDTHLNELRGRLLELESMIGSTSALSEQHQLMLRHKEFVESHEREKQKLIDQHEVSLLFTK